MKRLGRTNQDWPRERNETIDMAKSIYGYKCRDTPYDHAIRNICSQRVLSKVWCMCKCVCKTNEIEDRKIGALGHEMIQFVTTRWSLIVAQNKTSKGRLPTTHNPNKTNGNGGEDNLLTIKMIIITVRHGHNRWHRL